MKRDVQRGIQYREKRGRAHSQDACALDPLVLALPKLSDLEIYSAIVSSFFLQLLDMLAAADHHPLTRPREPSRAYADTGESPGANLPFLFFLLLLILGSQSPVIFYAISVATDVIPLFSDINGLLTQEAGPDAGILSLALLLLIVLLVPEFQTSLLAAGDILPFPEDLKNTIEAGRPKEPPEDLPRSS